jgi:hypothetical protein
VRWRIADTRDPSDVAVEMATAKTKGAIMSKSNWLRRRLTRLWPSDKGNVAIVFALTLPIIAGGAGLGVETTYWYYKDLQIQAAADAAAFAGALEKRSGSADNIVLASARKSAAQNKFDPALGAIEVNSPPLTGPNTANNAVEVLITLPLERFFSKLFADDHVLVRARAVARYETSASACLLALDPLAPKSLLFSGNSSMTLRGCNVMTNSIAFDAIRSQGGAQVSVDCLISAGGVDLTTHVELTECTNPVVGAPVVADPYADLPAPTPPSSCTNGNSATLSAGHYCHGLTINNNTVLAPGSYYISGGDFRVNGNANISGDGVTIYLDGDARVSMNGASTVNLSAPTSGDYSGILFFGDRDNSDSQINKFNGTADSHLTGSVYFASQAVQYLGDFAGASGCTRIVAGTIEWSGNAEFQQDCTSLGMSDIPSVQLVRIAE